MFFKLLLAMDPPSSGLDMNQMFAIVFETQSQPGR
jgi:hypothetical protein